MAGWKGFPTPGAAQLPAAIVQVPDFSTFGRLDFSLVARMGALAVTLLTFSLMLSDFFDTMGTVIGVGGEGGFLTPDGRCRGVNRVLLVDSLGAVFGGCGQRQQQHDLHRERGRRGRGRPDRAAAVVTGGPLPARHVVLAPGRP